MLHVMGFGTAWWDQGLKEYHGADGNDIRFVGEKATAVYNSTYADIASTDPNSHIGVPIEDGGGSGARGKHWDEGTFDHELMSTHVDNGEHITDLTLAALEDMGYETTFDEADELLGFV
jgi:hypothetical protein